MTSSFFNFSNVDILQYDSFEQNLSYEGQNFSQAYSKDSNFICTEAPCEDLFNPSSRSKKTSLNPFQSSFQCNFHYEHFETLNKKLQNFMESISSCSEKILKQELEKKILQNQMSSFSSCEEILESENCQIEESEKQKFKVDLKYEKKLREFLDEVCKKLIPEISSEFLAVADFIWVNYTKVMDQRLSESELINWAKNLSETKFKQYRKLLEKTKEICFSQDQSEIFPNFDEAIKGFMEFFFVTVILCVEQYFGNPYFQEDSIEVNSFKRASSESDCYSFDQFSELQQDIYGSKKLKF